MALLDAIYAGVREAAVWTDGSGAPNNAVGDNGDYYLRTDTGQVYRKAAGTYSPVYTPTNPTTAAPSSGIGAGNTEGVAATFARSDHNHAIRTGSTDLTIGTLTDGHVLARSGTTLATVTTTAAGLSILAATDAAAQVSALGLQPTSYIINQGSRSLGTVSTTPISIFASSFSLVSGATYVYEINAQIAGPAGGIGSTTMSLDFNSAVSYSSFAAKCLLFAHAFTMNTTYTSGLNITLMDTAAATSVVSATTSASRDCTIVGLFTTSSSGSFTPRVSWGTSNATAITLRDGSWMRLVRIS